MVVLRHPEHWVSDAVDDVDADLRLVEVVLGLAGRELLADELCLVIETPEARISNGKAPEGLVQVFFDVTNEVQSEWLHIRICDDGNGIDPEKIKAEVD